MWIVNIKKKEYLNRILLKNYLLIVYLITSFLYIQCNQRNIQSEISFIILKIIGTGYLRIFNEFFNPYPDEIYINNVSQS